METFLKIIGVIVLIIVVSPIILIGEESIRLQNNKEAMPLIVLSTERKVLDGYSEEDDVIEVENIANSIGFSLHVRVREEKESSDNYVGTIIGKEFWLFNSILIWGYIE